MKRTIAQKVHDARANSVQHTYRLVKTSRIVGDARRLAEPDEVLLISKCQYDAILAFLEYSIPLPEPPEPEETARQEEQNRIRERQRARIQQYISMCLALSTELQAHRVRVSMLYEAYILWLKTLENAPKQAMTRIIFRKRIAESGIKVRKVSGQIYALGVVLLSPTLK